MPRIFKVAALTGLLLLVWSALFADTFRYPFYWDDFHLIRSYTGPEIRSAFHAVIDPDKIETPGLRPCSIFLYNFQGSVFGENIVAHRIFMVVLMGTFMIATGTLLLELGLRFVQLGLVFALFVSSRVFASLVLWISLSHLIFAYIWIVLTAYFFIRWTKTARWWFFVPMLITCMLATFTREETYTLPVVLPILWMTSSIDLAPLRRVITAAVSLLAIVGFHYWLWHFLVPNALSPQISFSAGQRLFRAMAASWLPCGLKWSGIADIWIAIAWITFLLGLVFWFLRFANSSARLQFLGVCCAGALLSLPALGVARPFGIALPTIAFMSAVSIAIAGIWNRRLVPNELPNRPPPVLLTFLIIGIAVGIAGGIYRSNYVAQSLQEDSAVRAVRDGQFLFDLFDHPATIPPERRQNGLARLEHFGIRTAEDVKALEKNVHSHRDAIPRQSGNGLFLSKYDYLSF